MSCAGGRYGAAWISSGLERAAASRSLGLQLVIARVRAWLLDTS
ncbi:hypothetical protein MHH93_01910 [Priestia sp. FSL H7-0729]